MTDDLTPHEAFKEAVRIIGNQTKAAKVAGCSPDSISLRLKNKQGASPKWIVPLAKASGISRHVLSPELYPLESSIPTPPVSDDLKPRR